MANATKFLFVREEKESSKHKQQLLIGVQFLVDWLSANKLSIWQMPFFLLAVGEKERYYVNLQKEYVATPGGAYYQISVEGEPSTFNFVSFEALAMTDHTV